MLLRQIQKLTESVISAVEAGLVLDPENYGPGGHSEFIERELRLNNSLKDAITSFSKVATEINESIRDKEARDRVVTCSRHVEGLPYDLVTPARRHIKDSALIKRYNNAKFKLATSKKYWFFLFNDILMYTTVPNARGDCRMKYILPLIDTTVADIGENGEELPYPNPHGITNTVMATVDSNSALANENRLSFQISVFLLSIVYYILK